MKKGNKFAYDRAYYEELCRSRSVYGSAVPKEEEDWEESGYEDEELAIEEELSYNEEYETDGEVFTEQEKESKRRVKHVVNVNLKLCGFILLVTGLLVVLAYSMLSTKAGISETEKQISSAKMMLEDIKAGNAALEAKLDAVVDRNSLYSEALRLGMRYPESNTVVYYTMTEGGYVRQFADIR